MTNFSLLKTKKKKESHQRMVISTRTKGSCPCTDYKRRKSLCQYFSLQHLVYSICRTVLENISCSTLAGQNISGGFSQPFWTPSPGSAPSGFRANSLVFPRGWTTEHPVIFTDVRGAKNEDRLIGLSMLRNLEMCPSSSCFFVTVLMVLISIFEIIFSVIYVIQ